jgi:hypothetical protein
MTCGNTTALMKLAEDRSSEAKLHSLISRGCIKFHFPLHNDWELEGKEQLKQISNPTQKEVSS